MHGQPPTAKVCGGCTTLDDFWGGLATYDWLTGTPSNPIGGGRDHPHASSGSYHPR
jgi:hypothetical protein